MAEEKVLVVKRSVLETLGLFNGVNFNADCYLREVWKGTNVEFISRSIAENDLQYKQLIPYVIMSYRNTFLCYTRGKNGDEPRLSNKVSIGIGGHINPSDNVSLININFQKTYFNAVVREVEEEVIVETDHRDKIIGLINDDSNDVGRVHLGIIHFWQLNEPKVRAREEEICHLRFMNISELREIREKLESWSQLCLDCIDELAFRANT